MDPALEVGLSIPGPGAAVAQQHWTPHLRDLTSDFVALNKYELALDAGDFARPVRICAAADVTEDWLASASAGMVNAAHLRIRLRIPVETVSVQQTREALADVQRACTAASTLWIALQKTGHIHTLPK